MANKTSKLNPNAREFYPSNQKFPIFHHNHSNSNTLNYNHNFYIPFSFLPRPQPQLSTVHHHRRHFHDRTVSNQTSNPRGGFRGRAPRQTGGFSVHRRFIPKYNPRPRRTRSVYLPVSSSTSHTPTMASNNLIATTLMIKNIPSRYTREMLMEFIDEHCELVNSSNTDHGQKHAFDFLYLPIDFRTTLNKGYAFVNFTSPQAASGFEEKTNNQGWAYFKSKKTIQIAKAKLQGKDEMSRHYERMSFTCNDEQFLPVLFNPARDGTNANLVTSQTIGKCIY